MSKIVFFCIPAHGHTNPTLGVVKELVNRGHQVLYYSYNAMREKIEAAGATFVSCDDYDMEQKLTPKDAARVGKDLAFSTRILVDTTLALDDKVCADIRIGICKVITVLLCRCAGVANVVNDNIIHSTKLSTISGGTVNSNELPVYPLRDFCVVQCF